MSCHELQPPPAHTASLQCLYRVDPNHQGAQPPMDLSADAGADLLLLRTTDSHCLLLLTPRSKPMALPAIDADAQIFGLRFWPGALYQFVDQCHLPWTDQLLDAEPLWPQSSEWNIQDASDPEIFALLLSLLKWHDNAHPTCGSVQLACDAIRDTAGETRIDALAQQQDLTIRSLQRYFAATIGLSPKMVARISRLRQSCLSLANAGHINQVPQQYTDHAHMIREFKALTGCTPRTYLQRIEQGEIIQYEDGPYQRA